VRVLCHAQHLTGVGHAVLARVIATELATSHEVYLVDGGRFVPAPRVPVAPTRVPLPIVRRSPQGGLTGEHGEPGADVLARRSAVLVDAVRDLCPDVVVVDHYPFSKWELSPEIGAMIEAARRTNPHVHVVSSLRDIAPRTRYEAMTDGEYTERALSLLDQQFDALVVHSDPSFIRFDDYASMTRPLPVPMTHSGFVVEPVHSAGPEPERPIAVLSTGGIDSPAFLAAAITAFGVLAATGALGDMRLHVFAGLDAPADELAALDEAARGFPVEVHAFSGDFTAWLDAAALSISRCGYNTSAALLRSRVPAVIVPANAVSDQRLRALRFVQSGLAIAVDEERVSDMPTMVTAIEAAVGAPRPVHSVDLDGARTTRRLLEELVSGDRMRR
jgi:predicted glycosyltransferase